MPYIRKILDIAGVDSVVACWNSNQGEVENGSVKNNFEYLKGRIGLVHTRDLVAGYPWAELLGLLYNSGFRGFCLAEIAGSPEPERIMKYHKAVWDALMANIKCC